MNCKSEIKVDSLLDVPALPRVSAGEAEKGKNIFRSRCWILDDEAKKSRWYVPSMVHVYCFIRAQKLQARFLLRLFFSRT
jgi:hypothetical protein